MDKLDINYNSEFPTVSGRELHEALEVKDKYSQWFNRMCEYGFSEKKDFFTILGKTSECGGRPATDHQLTIPMAKEICMIQRSEKGKQFRQYFISVEEKWNSPEMVLKRATDILNTRIKQLEEKTAIQTQQLAELQPKASYYDVVLNCKDLLSTTQIAKDYGWSATRMNDFLSEKGIQYKQSGIWFLYQKYAEKGYTSTKTHTYNGSDGQIQVMNHHFKWWFDEAL